MGSGLGSMRFGGFEFFFLCVCVWLVGLGLLDGSEK
jgi:hypothetical protein